jgi:HD-GYP domain-containing protein (c-di-GMP phosphodiesterase class II)
VRKINPELWLLLFLVLIAAVLNFLVASQPMALMFYFLPTLYSAYRFGRRHATLTAFMSVLLVVVLMRMNPHMFNRQVVLPFDSRWFDLTVWGGVLMVAGYATGTLYERNQKGMLELRDGYDGMLAVLQQFLTNEKYSEAHSYRIAMFATKIAETLGLDPGSTEDLRTAALLRNVNELGISNEVLYKAVNISQEALEKNSGQPQKSASGAQALAGTLRRAIPIFTEEQELVKNGSISADASVEVQVLAMAENYEQLVCDPSRKLSPAQAQEIIVKSSGKKYDSMIVDAFVKTFGQHSQGAKA